MRYLSLSILVLPALLSCASGDGAGLQRPVDSKSASERHDPTERIVDVRGGKEERTPSGKRDVSSQPAAGGVLARPKSDSRKVKDTCFESPRTRSDAKQLVVMISNEEGAFGSGLIIGRDSDAVYILTANHVVRKGDTPYQGAIFHFAAPWGKEDVRDQITLLEHDPELDLAIAKVALASNLSDDLRRHLRGLCMSILVNPAVLYEGMPVYLMGHPDTMLWGDSTEDNYLHDLKQSKSNEQQTLRVKTRVRSGGYSGGGVFTDSWELIGIILSDGGGELSVLPIEFGLNWADWRHVPVLLMSHVAIYEFAAEPARVPSGGTFTLRWKTALGGICEIPGIGSVRNVDSRVGNQLKSTTRYFLTCKGNRFDGVLGKEIEVGVLKPPRIKSFRQALPIEATLAPGEAVLQWDAVAEKCILEGEYVPTTGSIKLEGLRKSRFYMLACSSGEYPSVSERILVTPKDPLPDILAFQSTPQLSMPGETVLLSWEALDVSECLLYEGKHRLASVPHRGSMRVEPEETAEYMLLCRGAGVHGSKGVSNTITVVVKGE